MPSFGDLEITLDLHTARRSADHLRDMLIDLRRRFDLAPFEYTKRVRIAPLEIPHSHPMLTLNTWVHNELGLLSAYLHERMHWYLTWYSHAHPLRWRDLFRALHDRHPEVPPDAAPDEFSIYLHLVVNWLEIETTSQFMDRDRVVKHARALPFYRWIYRTVIEDGRRLPASTTIRVCTRCGRRRRCRLMSCRRPRLRQKRQHKRRRSGVCRCAIPC